MNREQGYGIFNNVEVSRKVSSEDDRQLIYLQYIRAVNEFVKNFTTAVKDINPSLTVSATVMPETDNGAYFYGQDVSTMGKYVDVIIDRWEQFSGHKAVLLNPKE